MPHERHEPGRDESDWEGEDESSFLHFRVAFVLVALLIVGIALTLPFAIQSVVRCPCASSR